MKNDPKKERRATLDLDNHRFLENSAWEMISDQGVTYWNLATLGVGPRVSSLASLDFAEL